MCRLFFLLVTISLSSIATAQEVKLEELDRKNRACYKKVLKLKKKNKLDQSIIHLQKIVSNYPTFTRGVNELVSFYNEKGDTKSIIKVLENYNNGLPENEELTSLLLAEAYERDGKYEESIQLLSQVSQDQDNKEKLQRRIAEISFRKNALENPVDFQPEKLTGGLNTDKDEYHPVLTTDGSSMYFVRMGKGKYRQEDLFVAKSDGALGFQEASPLTVLNSDYQDGAFTLSADGNTIVFTSCGRPDSKGGCDLYISFKKGNKWTAPKNMGSGINSKYWDSSPSLSSDGRTVYFASKRPGGLGGSDIWSVSLNDNNRWQEVINLGETINTPGNEEAPSIHPDGKTLYMVSDGHIGMGSYDIFFSRYDQGKWCAPENIGYPINTDSREGGLFVDLHGGKAYYSTGIMMDGADNVKESGDIYLFDLPQDKRPGVVSYIKIEIRDGKSNGLMQAKGELVSLKDTTDKKIFDIKGQLLTPITPGEYSFAVKKLGYVFHSENILFPESDMGSDPFIYKVVLQPIEKEAPAPIVLKNIFFRSGSAELLSTSNTEINNLAQLLLDSPDIDIAILGHTDNVGSDIDNLRLSEYRAKAVYERLIAKGINATRIKYVGKGEGVPIADNDTEEGRQLNRRTEFLIIRNN